MDNKNYNKPDDNFSIEKELADMKKSLLVDEEDDKKIISDAINEKEAEKNKEVPLEEEKAKDTQASEIAPSEEKVEDSKEESLKQEEKVAKEASKPAPKKAPAKKAPAKTASKSSSSKTPAKKSSTSKSSPKKKPLTEAQKLAKKEKERLAKEKEKAKRREAVKKAKEKEKTRLAVKQAKEKEKARLEALIKKEKERSQARAIARKAAEEKLASLEQAQKTNDAITSDIDDIKMNKDFISEAKGLEKIGPKKQEVKKEQPKPKEENVSASLQRLREQIAAKKDLEQRIMDGKAAKNDSLAIQENLRELEAKNKDLKEKLAKAQAEVNEPVEEDANLAKLREEIASLEAKVRELEAIEESLKNENAKLKDDIASIEENLNNKHEEALKVKDEEYANLQSRFDGEVNRLTKEVEDLKNAKDIDTSKLEKNLNKEFNAKLKATEKENAKALSAKQKEVDQVSKELTNTKIQLTKANNALLSKQDELENVKTELNQKLSLANDEINLLKRDLDLAKDRNVKDADVLSEVEEQRNKLVEQNRELEKGKKEVELQESYLNLYKQEIDAKAAEAVKAANDELARYKADNKVQENIIRAEEQAKYQELYAEYNDAQKALAEYTKQVNELEVKAIEYERNDASQKASLNSLSELNESLKNEVERLNERVKSLTNEDIASPDSEKDDLRSELAQKDLELAKAKAELEDAKARFEEERTAFTRQSEAINKQIDEMLKGVEENETSIANTALVIENYREALESEKNAHFEAEQQLYEALKAKDEELRKLEDAIKQTKLDNQIGQIANMVQDLQRRDMFAPRAPYQSQYYGPYDPYDARMRDDQNKELAKRDEIIASLQRDRKKEVDALNAKIEALEAQVRDLNEALAKKQEVSSSNINYQELDEYMARIRMHLVASNLDGFKSLADLLDAYQEEKKKESLVYANETDKLNIASKYASDSASKQTIDAKREFLDDYYAKTIKELDANLERASSAIKKNDAIVSPVVVQSGAAPVVVSVEDTAPASDLVKEEIPYADVKEVANTPDGEVVSDEAPIYDSYEEKAEAFERLEPLEVKQTPLIKPEEDDNQVVITFDSEYLNKLNNIRRTRKSLEERKVVESANHKIELSNNETLQKEYARKIEELKNRIDEMTLNYQESDDHSDEALEKFEVEKQKVFFELTTRQSQLNKLSDDDVRKINLRYHNIIKGIEDQLLRLEDEEKQLRDTYLLKQKKEESRLNREAALNKQFEDANVVKNEVEEPRIIESQDEIRERKFRSRYEGLMSSQPRKLIDDKDVANIVVNEHGNVVGAEEVKPIDKEEVKETLETNVYEETPEVKPVDTEEKMEVKESKISAKEVELRKKYDSFCSAEKVYSNDIASVREYKRLKEQYLACEKAIEENNDKISGLNEVLKASNDSNEIANLRAQINELKNKGESLKDNRDYVKRQCNEASKDKHVKDYNKLIQKIEDAAAILKKYQAKREKKDR